MIEMRKSNDMLESHMKRFEVRIWNYENLIGWLVIVVSKTVWVKIGKNLKSPEKLRGLGYQRLFNFCPGGQK